MLLHINYNGNLKLGGTSGGLIARWQSLTDNHGKDRYTWKLLLNIEAFWSSF